MRIISGKYRRIELETLEGDDITRPSKDMLKEAMFSTLFNIEDSVFLDLFGGTGAVGLEAISRGAKALYTNDVNKKAYNIIRKNINKLKANNVTLTNLDYQDCLRGLKGIKFDYIFLDPPYVFNEFETLMEMINELDLLNDDGIIIWETQTKTKIDEKLSIFKEYKTKKYGISTLHYYRKES